MEKLFSEIEKKTLEKWLENQSLFSERDIVRAYKNRENKKQVILDQSINNEEIVGIWNNERIWHLQSRYAAKNAEYVWAQQYRENVTDDTVFLVFGLADGGYIEEILKLNENCLCIVYEPCIEIFWKEFGKTKILDLLQTDRVFLLVNGINESMLVSYMDVSINYANFQLVQLGVLPNYDKLFPNEYKWMLNKYLYEVKKITLDRNTEMIFSREIVENEMRLAKDILEHYSIIQLRNIIDKYSLQEMPAVLVSAGPSLDKNIDQLKKIQNSVFILAVDTALNTVLQHDIVPDMTISVDGHKPLELFKNERTKRIPIILSSQSNKKILPYVSDDRFYEISTYEFIAKFYEENGKEVDALPTGGSVANNACSLLQLMGFHTIVFMGQDLAYPEGKLHTVEAYEQEQEIDKNSKRYVTTVDIYGKEVFTEPNMLCYLQWFEYFVSVYKNIRFIDATEGGARIEGTEILTMEDVIKEYGNIQYDKTVLWKDIKPYLTKKEVQTAEDALKKMPDEFEIIKQKLKKGIEYFDLLEKTYLKDNCEEWMKKELGKISEISEKLERSWVFSLVRYFSIGADYKIKGSLLQYDRKNVMNQMEDLLKSGKELFVAYLKGVDELELYMGQMK